MHLPTGGRLAAGFALAVVLGFTTACGGSGGGGIPEPPPLLELGTFSATVPTRVSRTFLNPLAAVATVSAPDTDGPFSIDPGDVPVQANALAGVNLGIVFIPTGPGEATGTIRVRFTAGAQVADQLFEVRATGEALTWTVNPDPLDFGDVLPGDSSELEVTLRNDSQRSPVTFTSALMPSTAVAFTTNPFPLTIRPGETVSLFVTYSPMGDTGDGGILRIGSNDVGGPVDVNVWANSTGTGERVIDFGALPLSLGDTPELSVDVPATAVSLTFEGTMTDAAVVGLRSLVGPGGKVYENVSSTGPVLWMEGKKTFTVHLPSSDQLSTRLVAGGGTYKFRLRRISGSGVTMDVRVIMEMRSNGTNPNAVLPLNIFLASGLTPTKSTAANDPNLQSMLTQVDQILSAQGISLGDIDYYDILNSSFDQIAQGEEEELFQLSGAATKVRCNLFLVKQVWGGMLLGLSGAIDGSKRNGDRVTGVVSLYTDVNTSAIAIIVAHEMLHYLGLWHTVEANGVWDQINDTPNCPAVGTGAGCSVEGGGLLMHWQGNGGKVFTAGQGLVVRGHPLLHAPGQTNQLRKKPIGPWAPDAESLRFLQRYAGGWCGTRR